MEPFRHEIHEGVGLVHFQMQLGMFRYKIGNFSREPEPTHNSGQGNSELAAHRVYAGGRFALRIGNDFRRDPQPVRQCLTRLS
ncbi:hypothetical protein ASG39_18440 [Rhizobium sp. Leaf371]|nr:hypothetical protein ASG39_18440 [Rhizobium sp. Leaf371]